jgi:hypothetical protein
MRVNRTIASIICLLAMVSCQPVKTVPKGWPPEVKRIPGAKIVSSLEGTTKQLKYLTKSTPSEAAMFYQVIDGWHLDEEKESNRDSHMLKFTKPGAELVVTIFVSKYYEIEGTIVCIDYTPK